MASRYHFAQNQRPTLGAEIGSALGTGLGRGLTALAETKLDSMLARQKQGQLTAEFTKMGIPEQQAAYLAKQDPETQWQAVRQWWMSQGYEGSDIPESVHQDWSGQSPLQSLDNAQQPTEAGPQQGALAAIQNQGQQQAVAQGNAMQALGAQAPQAPIAPPAKEAPIPPMPKQRKARDLGEAFRMAEETTPKTAKEKKITDAAIKRSESAIDTSDQMEGIANEMLALLDTGKVGTGITGAYSPIFLQSDESQQFEALSNELAGLLASRSGVATNFKIKLAQSMKPNLRQSTNTQRKLAEKIIETSKELRSKAQERIGIPQNASAKQKAAQPESSLVNELSKTGYPVGTIAQDEATGEKLVFNGTDWVKG